MTEKSLEETLLEITEKALSNDAPIVLRGEVVRKVWIETDTLGKINLTDAIRARGET
jgi:hypothetical protein